MIKMDLSLFQKKHPKNYKLLASKMSNCFDAKYTSQFFYTLARKQGSWLGDTRVNLVLKLPLNPEHHSVLFCQKSVELSSQLGYVARQPSKYVRLSDCKMVARCQNVLTLAFTIGNDLEDWVVRFTSEQVAAEWQTLLKQKKRDLKNMKSKNSDHQHIKQLTVKIANLEKELGQLKSQYLELLSQKHALEDENINIVRQYNDLMRENAAINQTNINYRNMRLSAPSTNNLASINKPAIINSPVNISQCKMLPNPEDYPYLMESNPRRSFAIEIQHAMKSQEGMAIFYISQRQWKQCFARIDQICASFELGIAEWQPLKELVPQLRTAVSLLQSSVIVLAQDSRKSVPTRRQAFQ